ncbi:hypothetical protein [Hasllibacter sp. MH4015]|uniref:hypothetical protein n=1 Tax=Hasllibacter sp. MH4015 TaxID=2854029 RepID=UPI001CD3419E|nr:hypothetical protein [Hasllibacter sp. MH4015]
MAADFEDENPVATLLSRRSAPDLVGGLRLPEISDGPVVVVYGEGRPGSRAINGNVLTLLIGALCVLISGIVTINAVRSGNFDLNNVMGIVLPLVIGAFIAGPSLLRAKGGTLQWTRRAELRADEVVVTDKTGSTEVRWSEPLAAYRDIHQAFVHLSSPDGEGDGLTLETVTLRHRDRGKDIYVLGTKKTVMGGMNFSDMVRAGREGRKADVEAAFGDTRNPQVEAIVAALVERTGLPLTQDLD